MARKPKLLTKAIEKKLAKAPMRSTEGGLEEAPVIVKFFSNFSNWTWYVVEAELQENGDWLFFGLVDGIEKELGYFLLSELQSVKHPMFRIPGVERDCYFGNHKLDEFLG